MHLLDCFLIAKICEESPLYPDEEYEEITARIIIKKEKIERILDVC